MVFREIKCVGICTLPGGDWLINCCVWLGTACCAVVGLEDLAPGHLWEVGLLLRCTGGLMALLLVKLSGHRQSKVRWQCLLVTSPGEGTGKVCSALWGQFLDVLCICTDVSWASGVFSPPHP